MSALEGTRDLAGLTLDAVLGGEKRPAAALAPTPAQMNRTLLDIIRDDEPHVSLFGHKDKKTWKAFRERLRLRRSGGSAWTSSVPVPASDIPIQNNNQSFSSNYPQPRSFIARRNSVRFTGSSPGDSTHAEDSSDNPAVSGHRAIMCRRTSSRYGPSGLTPSESMRSDESSFGILGDEPPLRSLRAQMSRHNSIRNPDSSQFFDAEEETGQSSRRLGAVITEDRAMSAREAVAAQEAAEAEAAAQAAAEAEEEEYDEEEEDEDSPTSAGAAEAAPVRMSLMDLLEETDRQMGFVGSSYTMGDDYDCEEEEEEDDDDGMDGGDGIEHTCCVCMVRHKGAAFIPCGHTFCRLCSRELWVQRGNCPLCNGYISEILDIF
ncbi:hypothetical protein JCGZ_17536 [Jatropha curcas]|uniref:RING-type domain-containing protein n=2 Tax=Jatropha curcas TaxID=180498 RepID=A0A067JUA1_JATCU|nr:uncharacterized protein LOC105644385 isoform X2 [Jatropha curcas]KDP26378.1 hypothetical protein JCGZ_17536 [Jatropha curcas]